MAKQENTNGGGAVDPGNPLGGMMGGLGALHMMLSGQPLAGSDQIDEMAKGLTGPIMDPSTKWLKFAAGALAPTAGGRFNESMSNALGALGGAQSEEAQLKAKYLPIVAQALLQRQMQQFTMAQNAYKLNTEFEQAATGALTGLLSDKDPNAVSVPAVVNTLKSLVAQGRIPAQFAQQYFQSVPPDAQQNPEKLRSWLMSRAVGSMEPNARLPAVTPKVELRSPTEGTAPFNVNPSAGTTGVGPMGGGAPATLKPADRLPVGVETPQGPAIRMPTTGKAAIAGSPEATAITAEALGGGGGAPSRSLVQDPATNEADKTSGGDFTKYQGSLADRVTSLQDVNQRIAQMREYTAKFRTGATAELRMKAASTMKDLLLSAGAPEQQAAALGDKLMGGDLTSAQAFQKVAVQGAMEALRSAMQSGRITQGEFAVFQRASPNLGMDPNGLEKVNNYFAQLLRNSNAEQNFITQQRAAGVPVNGIRAGWANYAQTHGYVSPTITTNEAKGSPGTPSRAVLGVDNEGRRMRINPANGLPEYE